MYPPIGGVLSRGQQGNEVGLVLNMTVTLVTLVLNIYRMMINLTQEMHINRP